MHSQGPTLGSISTKNAADSLLTLSPPMEGQFWTASQLVDII